MKLSKVAAFVLVLFLGTSAHGGEFNSLVKRSPFVDRRNSDVIKDFIEPRTNRFYNCRTMIKIGDRRSFNIESGNGNVWVREGETKNGISVIGYDEKTKVLRINDGDEQEIEIRLHRDSGGQLRR
jgi:hypothetical protein